MLSPISLESSESNIDLGYIIAKQNAEEVIESARQRAVQQYSEFVTGVAIAESGNRYTAKSCSGTFKGKYQFGPDALQDIDIDAKQFTSSPYYQEKAMLLYLRKNKEYMATYLSMYEGEVINGIEMTESGILAAAHLGGHVNVKKYLRSNGEDVFKDGNGTSIEKYLVEFAGYELNLNSQKADQEWFALL